MKTIAISLLLICLAMAGCSSSKKDKTALQGVTLSMEPGDLTFDTDSAIANIRHQVEFGPRVPGSDGHKKAEQFILNKMKDYGADTVIEQKGEVTAFNGDVLPFNNILARFNTKADKRILLIAHYDTRPWADNEKNTDDRKKPILGANDGGSGTGVIMEIARVIGENNFPLGVDFLFVDAEDYGTNQGWGGNEESWCLGSQYWADNHPYGIDEMPMFGILLDMVGGINARFHREFFSDKAARPIVDKVWSTASSLGFSGVFINELGGSLIDDHNNINRAGIPCIDIVECNNAVTGSFPPTWHTLHDNMSSIDPKSIKAVGTTVLRVIENEAKNIQ